tara:strand:+ start:79 stop:672 length:594 start_codon:yes stop_codon:yes gene_type:complete
MIKAASGNYVRVHYRGTLNDGSEFDSSYARDTPVSIELGSPQVIKGFSDAIVGMTKGETRKVSIKSEDAYGPSDPAAFAEVPRENFPEDFDFQVGGMIQGVHASGARMVGTISEVREYDIVVDMNHPMAGKDLNFEIELLEIETSEEEQEEEVTMANWNSSMKKAELFEIAKTQGLKVNTRSTKAQILEALSAEAAA